jgi:hypothetical protein
MQPTQAYVHQLHALHQLRRSQRGGQSSKSWVQHSVAASWQDRMLVLWQEWLAAAVVAMAVAVNDQ